MSRAEHVTRPHSARTDRPVETRAQHSLADDITMEAICLLQCRGEKKKKKAPCVCAETARNILDVTCISKNVQVSSKQVVLSCI